MKPSVSVGVGVTPTARTLNGNSGGTGGVTFVVQHQQRYSTSSGHNTGQLNIYPATAQQQQQQLNGGGGGSSVVFRRFQNSNLVQVRRVITQQPQQFQKLAEISSSESSEDFEPAGALRITRGNENGNSKQAFRGGGGGARGGDRNEDIMDLDENESVGDIDVSVVGGGDEDDDEDLLIDQEMNGGDGDDDDDGSGEGKSALELNGAGVDSQYLRHVIETQILDRHKTRIKDWDGTKGHMCQSCHETFLSESGLETHRNRRILHILFYCRICKRDLSFFNKCRLLQHLRNHRVTPTVSGLQHCTMIRLLPESEYLHFEYEDCTSSSEEEDCGSGGGSSPPKRLKPSRFRKVKSSGSGNGNSNDKDSPDNSSALPNKPTVAAQSTNATTAPATTTTTTVISTSGNTTGTIKFAASGVVQPRSDQVTVIKSTGSINNTAPKVLPNSSASGTGGIAAVKEACASPRESSDGSQPQIRIRNLSQITVSVNDGENPDYDEDPDEMDIQPVVTSTSTLRTQVVKVTAPAITTNIEKSTCNQSTGKNEYRCFKCDKDFDSCLEFFKHLEEAEKVGMSSKSLHRCPTDDIPSWSQCQYVFHTKVFHEKSVPFMCPGCGHEHPDYNSLLQHVTNHCFYLSQRSRYMCAASLQKCSFADKKSVKTEPEIIDHLKKEHSRSVLQCLHCTQGFATENWLLKHLAEAHNIVLDESKPNGERDELIKKTTRPLTQCLICNILFPNGPTYLQHVYLNFHVHILYAKILECQSCEGVFESNEELVSHRKQNERCRNLDPFRMRVSDAELGSSGQNGQLGMAPTPIKVIANPAALITSVPNKAAQHSQSQPTTKQHYAQQQESVTPSSRSQPATAKSTVVAVISSANGTTSGLQTMQQQQQQQRPLQQNHPKQVNIAFQQNPQKSSQVSIAPKMPAANKKSFFDDLLSCQFCERLVLFSSLRKHEDQCSGLSTVAPGFCLACRQNFGNKRTLSRHGLVHIREGLPICLFCNNRNIRPTHPTSNTPSDQETLYALKKHLYSNHTSRAVKFPYQCTLCDKYCKDKRAAEFHIKEHQFRTPTASAKDPDPSPIPTAPEDLQKLIKLRRKVTDPRRKFGGRTIEVYYCPVCKNREFALEIGLARHLTLVHQKDPNSLNLSLLKKASTARRYAVKGSDFGAAPQQRATGDIKPAVRTNTPNTTSQASHSHSSTPAPVTAPSNRFSSNIVLRKRIAAASVTIGRKPSIPQRQVPNTRQRSSTESSSKELRPSTSSSSLVTRSAASALAGSKVRRKDGTFHCIKCPKFTCKSENEFCEHVKWKHVWPETEIQKLQYGNKLEEPSEFWCPECNIVLVAKPSLVRHLKFAHDYITNVDEYMQKIGYDGKKPIKPNQCEVCYFQCADDRELQQHIRTHGMAFLRLRQQRQSTSK